MDGHSNDNLFSSEDIQRYHQGEMTPQERHALEKAALDDPFLADALEGYVYATTSAEDLAYLNQKINQKIVAGKVVPISEKEPNTSWMRIAALFLVLAGAGWAVYQLSFSNQQDISLNTSTQKQETVTQEQPTNTNTSVDSSTVNTNTQTAVSDQATADKKPVEEKITTKKAVAISTPVPEIKNEVTAAMPQQMDNEAVVDVALSGMAKGIKVKDQQVFSGKVIDANGAPLPNVSIIAQNNKDATLSDSDGNFSLRANDSVLTATASAFGYEQNRLFLNAPKQNTIVLQQSENNLQEVVVNGISAKRASKEVAKNKTEELMPIGGLNAFEEYVKTNIQIPESNSTAKTSIVVTLSFDIDKNGRPQNIQPQNTLCAECNHEAIRLLKEGPKWEVKKNKKAKVTIRF
jgi:hypothetical protein